MSNTTLPDNRPSSLRRLLIGGLFALALAGCAPTAATDKVNAHDTPTTTVKILAVVTTAGPATTTTLGPVTTLAPATTAGPNPTTIVAPAPQGLSNNNTYTNSDGQQVHSPAYTDNGQAPAGASAQCGDGTYSFSQHRSGTCSHHGGVARWL
jgi:hypothetical protein